MSGLLWSASIVVSVVDLAVLRDGRYNLAAFEVVGAAFLLVGLAPYGIARRTLGEFFSEDVRTTPQHKLVTGGPYRLIRHPIYLAEILFGFSIPMILGSLYGFLIMVAPIPMLLRRIGTEEKVLASRFGRHFLEYSSRTKKLIPYVY